MSKAFKRGVAVLATDGQVVYRGEAMKNKGTELNKNTGGSVRQRG